MNPEYVRQVLDGKLFKITMSQVPDAGKLRNSFLLAIFAAFKNSLSARISQQNLFAKGGWRQDFALN